MIVKAQLMFILAVAACVGGWVGFTHISRTPRHAVADKSRVPVPQVTTGRMTWQDDPSLMDSSWREWPSLVNF